MRILLDESVPSKLGLLLTGHTFMTVQRQGWANVKNGNLLALGAANGFDLLLTADKGMAYQQNLTELPM
jgi:predicted nuclease of predicted toxin-antitoxin system